MPRTTNHAGLELFVHIYWRSKVKFF